MSARTPTQPTQDDSSPAPLAAGPWTHLSHFQVTYLDRSADNSTARVFRNGRQQVPVKVVIEGRDANNQVAALPLGDLQRMKLVLYNTGGAVPKNTTVSANRNSAYDYYPEDGIFSTAYNPLSKKQQADTDRLNVDNDPPLQPIADEHIHPLVLEAPRTVSFTSQAGTQVQGQELLLWVSTTSSETLRVSASITKPNGATFHTRSSEVPAGGAPSGGKFNSSLTISPQLPRAFPYTAFSSERTDHEIPFAFGGAFIDVDIYEIWLTDTTYKLRDSVSHTTITNRGWFYGEGRGRPRSYYHYGPDVTLSTRIHLILPFFDLPVQFPVNTKLAQGKISVVRVSELIGDGVYFTPGEGRFGFIDNFGNESIIYLSPIEDGNRIQLSDRA